MNNTAIIEYPNDVSNRLHGHFEKVPMDDPIREIMCHISSFEDALTKIREADFPDYGFFLKTSHPITLCEFEDSNLFFEKSRNFTLRNGCILIPHRPLFVYRRTRDASTTIQSMFIPFHKEWIMEQICPRFLQKRNVKIELIANGHVEHVCIHQAIWEAMFPNGSKELPLLVLSTPKDSIQFARFVLDILHCTQKDVIEKVFAENKHLIDTMSVDIRKKMYDIFPEEFVALPHYVWRVFRSLDKYDMTEEDVSFLSLHFQSKK